jgi:hypothetical protein
MPSYSLTVCNGVFSDADVVMTCIDDEAARREGLAICADLGRDIASGLILGSEWRMIVADEAGQPVFRFRLVTEVA